MRESVHEANGTRLYIGDWKSVEDMDSDDLCISVAQDCRNRDDMHFPLYDGHKNKSWKLDFTLDTLHHILFNISHRTKDQDILIHCAAGMSRSPCVAAALMAMKSGNMDAAWASLEHKMTYEPDIHPKLKEDIENSVRRLQNV